jgi:membrane-anchored protein YejM (alkaline phosphatase superfamily)
MKKGKNSIDLAVLNRYPDSRDEYRISLNDIKYSASKDLDISYEGIKVIEKGDKKSLLVENHGQINIVNSGKEQEFHMNAQGKIYLLPSEKVVGYRAEVEYMDEQIGRLIEKLNQLRLLNKTLVVLVGDHGEGLGDHTTRLSDPHFGHIHFLYSEYVKVPLIIYNPFLKEQDRRREELTSILDVAPTVLRMMGWKKIHPK